EHLDSCDDCRERVAREATAAAPAAPFFADLLVGEWSEPWHLSDEQVSAYVDGSLDSVERELVNSHLEICPTCVQTVRELRSFRALLSTSPPQPVHPLPPQTLASRWRSLWRSSVGRFTLQTLVPVAVAALLVAFLPRMLSPVSPPNRPLPGRNAEAEKIVS